MMQITPQYRITTAVHAPAPVLAAAEELKEHLRLIAGFDVPVASGDHGPCDREILVGDSARLRSVAPDIDVSAMRDEEYILRTVGDRLIIAGGGRRGTLYGVYALLRDYLGCRWFTPDCSVIPARSSIDLPRLDEHCRPAFEYRNFILAGVNHPAWSARNGYNGFNSPDDPAFGGHVAHWQYGHSLHALCPAEDYFEDHPEYFDSTSRQKATVDDYINLCFTNDTVVRIVADNMRAVMADAAEKWRGDLRETPPTVFYLAQHDGGQTCRCPSCQRIIDDQGALSAPLIHFCNRVVEEIGDEFPDFRMMTIAYRFSRRPPRTLRPHPRLIVQLCSIECCQSHPYATCDDPDDVLFRQDLEGWRALTDNLWIWDYMPRLWHPFLTGPGFEPMAANYRWFHEHGVRGMFTQTGGERDFKWMNAYLMCQMMRDPRQDWATLRDEFMVAYYGAAAQPLGEFLDAVHESVVVGNHHLHYKEGTVKPFFSDAVIAAGDRLFAAAADAVAADPKRSARVEEEYMHFLCTKLQHACRDSVLNNCTIENGRYRFARASNRSAGIPAGDVYARSTAADKNGGATKSPASARGEWMEQAVQAFSDWKMRRFGNHGTGGYTRKRAESCTMHVESDLITLDNGTLELEFLPRLAGRMVGLRHRCTGHNFMHMAPCADGHFNLANGYREEWLAAPGPYEQESTSGWSSRTSDAAIGSAEAGAGASVAGKTEEPGYVFETGGKFLHPLQWERWTRLAGKGGTFHIESMVVNRGIHEVNAPVETILPLDLGDVDGLRLDGELMTGGSVELTAAEAADGITLANPKARLSLNWRATGDVIEKVVLQPDAAAGHVTVRIQTKPVRLTPGAGRRFCQYIQVSSN